MTVSIWTDSLAFRGRSEFNHHMTRNLGYILASIGLIGGLLWLMSRIDDGPQVTGPSGSEIRVSDVPNPATDPPPTSATTDGGQGTAPTTVPDSSEDIWAVPAGFRQLLERDAIPPIYDPVFVSAEATTWTDDVLVVGVVINGDARAYPVGYLNRREMVIDTVGDVPVLVTW